jgi:flavodoxin
MKALVVYDSQFGNTQKIAETAAKELGGAVIRRAGEVKASDWKGITLLVVGSPTQGGRPTVLMQTFLTEIRSEEINGVKAVCFDTRLAEAEQNFALRFLIRTIGYAAEKMEKILINKGAKPAGETGGFIVKGKEGPIREGETERVKKWVKKIQLS